MLVIKARGYLLQVLTHESQIVTVVERGVEVGRDGEDVEHGVREECRLFRRNLDILDNLSTRIGLETEAFPSSLRV